MGKVGFISIVLPALLLAGWAHSSPAGSEGSRVRYRVKIHGVKDRELRHTLLDASQVHLLRGKRAASLTALHQRAAADVPRLESALRAHGYYQAAVQARVREDARPIRVHFDVQPGPRYRIGRAEVHLVDPEPGDSPLRQPDILLKRGQPFATSLVLAEEEQLLRWFEDRGHPFPVVAQRRVVVDHDAGEVSVAWRIQPGPRLRFGALSIEGLDRVRASAVRERVTWKEGARYRRSDMEEYERLLLRSGLFSTTHLRLDADRREEDLLPLTLRVTERKHRTVRAGLHYRSDIGLETRLAWEHYNLFGRGDHFETTGFWSPIHFGAEAAFDRAVFHRPDQSLRLNLRAGQEEPDAYESRYFEGRAAVERSISRRLTVQGGTAYKFERVEQLGDRERFGLLSFPAKIDWNDADDLLDPARGARLLLQAAPYQEIMDGDLRWVRGQAEGRGYLRLLPRPRLVSAVRIAAGTLAGEDRDRIPADERFYAGGGGSIRGYEFQKVGPIADDNSTPLGGASIIETSLELRLTLNGNWGVVAFLDGGMAYEDAVPDGLDELRWGAGLGARYFTPIGPIRVDAAIPLDREAGDAAHQFYISLGQAF
jgi:translocation and assembly module TamA